MDRRRFLKVGGAATIGLAFGGCAPGIVAQRAPRRPPVTLYPVEVSMDRIIRTTVGLRPSRESGFRLEAARYDEKTVIHNFGHGGAGMSLSWGTGQIAADLALAHEDRRAAVIGCGIVGLTAARQLQRRGFEVTIYAKALPPYTTSNMSFASFTPTSGLVSRRTSAWDAMFRHAVEVAYREHQLLVGRDYGVSWIDSYAPTNNRDAGGSAPANDDDDGGSGRLLPASVELGAVLLEPGEHPFDTRYARRSQTLRFEPSVYLEALMRDVLVYRGDIRVRAIETIGQLMDLPERLIINCTGLGAKELFGDEELTPVKGQLVVLPPQPEVTYTLGGMLPRNDGIVLGHVQQRGVWSMEVDEAERVRVVENAVRLFSRMRPPSPGTPPTRIARTTGVPPVESFFDLSS